MELYKLPVGTAGESAMNYLVTHCKGVFAGFGVIVLSINAGIKAALLFCPPAVTIAAVIALGWRVAGRGTAVFAAVSLVLLWNLELWEPTVVTVSLVLTATLLSLVVAIPLGALMAEVRAVSVVLTPVLDFLQTMPRFVYLIPGVIVFGIDTVPGVVATMTLAIPPPARLTALGIGVIDHDVIEAAEAFGCSRWQLLRKVKLPLARPSILLGVNQCLMMSLSMVVIAAMIGAGGLGADILTAITRLDAGQGFEAGLGVVVVAILVDRLTKGVVAGRASRWRAGRTEP